MAKKSLIARANAKPKFSPRKYLRCSQCGRPHAVYKKFMLCRLCFRKMALIGLIPGIRKASW